MFADFFSLYPIALPVFAAILGLLVGSFLNVVIYRYPLMMENDWRQQCHEFLEIDESAKQNPDGKKQHWQIFNLAKPDSHCPQCKHPISARENIPVISYLLQGAKCRHCKTHISVRYPLIETVSAVLSALAVTHFGFSYLSLAVLILTWTLIVLTMIDFDHQLLPDDLTMPLLWLGLLVNSMAWLTDLHSAVLGAAGGYLILWAVYWAFKLITGREGMGFGDFKLLAALGAWLGWQSLPAVILLSSFVGAVVGLSLILVRGQDKNIPIPFGPYLASAGFITLLWGDKLQSLFISLTG